MSRQIFIQQWEVAEEEKLLISGSNPHYEVLELINALHGNRK